MREAETFCRICTGLCGLRVKIDDDDRIIDVRGDKAHAMTTGFACLKGLQAADIHRGADRLLHPLKRRPDGSFERIDLNQALDEIGGQLKQILARDGPEAIAAYKGTQLFRNTVGAAMLPAFLRAIGSPAYFTTMTIDQSAKWVTSERLGGWRGGRYALEECKVWLCIGANPLVTLAVGTLGSVNPVKELKAAKARGMKVIVIDPRLTETARYADLFLQPRPGEDPTIAACLLNIILSEEWHDAAFCRHYVKDLDALAAAVAPFTPAYGAKRAGLNAASLREAAALFARDGHPGVAFTGTGPDMALHSNLANHLYECLNVICGKFPREGARVPNPGVLGPRRILRAEVAPPTRSWEKGHKSRVSGKGTLFGEMMTGVLAEEILVSGPGQIKALVVDGGNPANALPDQHKAIKAMRALELLVCVDPIMSETARLAHYILPPKLMFERADVRGLSTEVLSPAPFGQYTPPIVQPPPGAEVVDDWRVFWELAKRMDRPITLAGVELDFEELPTTDDLLEVLTRSSAVPLSEVKRRPGGKIFDVEPAYVEPASPEANGRFDVCPADIGDELRRVYLEGDAEPASAGDYTHSLIVRRSRDTMNSAYRALPAIAKRNAYNPAYLHVDDLAANGLVDGDRVDIVAPTGRIQAVVRADATVRPGVVSMTHGYGEMPDASLDYARDGSSTCKLVSGDLDLEQINAMARMTGIPVRLVKSAGPTPDPVTTAA